MTSYLPWAPVAAFIAFGRAKLWPTLVLLSLIFSPLAAHAACEDELLTPFANETELIAQTKFIDISQLGRLTQTQIPTLIETYKQLKVHVEKRQKAHTKKQMETRQNLPPGFAMATFQDQLRMEEEAGIHALNQRSNQLEEDLRGIGRFIDLLERVNINPASLNLTNPAILTAKVKVDPNSPPATMKAIVDKLKTLKVKPENLVFRYFPIARQDLVRDFGSDNHGRKFNSGSQWDEFGLEGILEERGLQVEDGFYAVPYELAIEPFEMIHNFIRGERALAIYDLRQLEDQNTDFYIFNQPEQKKKALLAIILPEAR